ncbi:MAG TPA: hypothetical protein DCG54_08710 [Anaerolineae bacterium]|jgi:hypothetical protein|nr:hypothetical protein [Anaerolineae bacterium]
MTLPTILFGILLSSAYGAGYHVWRGGSIRRLTLFLVLGWAGFWGGDTLGWSMGWDFGAVGNLNVGMGTLGAAAFLLIGDFVSRIGWREQKNPPPDRRGTSR